MSLEEEASLRDYACSRGLTNNHLAHNPLSRLDLQPYDCQSSEGCPELFQIDEGNGTLPAERINIDADALSLLAAVTRFPREPPARLSESVDADVYRHKELKIEAPLLRTDHDMDMQRFGKAIIPDFENEYLPLEAIDNEAGDGPEWPSKYARLPDQLWDQFRAEKISVSNTDLCYLVQTLKWHEDSPPFAGLEDDEALPKYHRNAVSNPITPPLLPMSPETSPYVPSSKTWHLEMLSEATSPIKQEIRQAEATVFRHDAIQMMPISSALGSVKRGIYTGFRLMPFFSPRPKISDRTIDSDSTGEMYCPLLEIKESVSPPLVPRVPIADHKVEVPLPLRSPQPPPPWADNSVPFSSTLAEIMPELPGLVSSPEKNPEEEINTFFEHCVAPRAVQAERKIEQEQLQEADTTQRVLVPVMDFSLPKAPWDITLNAFEPSEALGCCINVLVDLTSSDLKAHMWQPCGKKDRELTWVAIPSSLAKVDTRESIEDDGSAAAILGAPECVDPKVLLWKREGLRILDDLEDSDGEELELGVFPSGNDLTSLVQKRNLELDQAAIASGDHLADQLVGAKAFAKRRKTLTYQDHSLDKQEKPADTSRSHNACNLLDFHAPALTALGGYMGVRKNALTSSQMDVEFDKTSDQSQRPEEIFIRADNSKNTWEARSPLPKVFMMPKPDVIPEDIRQFMFSDSLLSNRNLSRRVLALYPTAQVIERTWLPRADKQKLRTEPSGRADATMTDHVCSDEVDVILSPTTGLLLTTLQKLKQRSLPGQGKTSSHTELQDRVAHAAKRFESLILIVHHSMSSATSADDLSSSDCDALSEFTAFCSALNSGVSIIQTLGDDEHLARWIVASMVKHSLCDNNFQLMQEEGAAEIFIRNAGLNAYAAQVVLAGSKNISARGPYTQNAPSAFVHLSLDEKLKHFECLVGRRSLVRLTNTTIPAPPAQDGNLPSNLPPPCGLQTQVCIAPDQVSYVSEPLGILPRPFRSAICSVSYTNDNDALVFPNITTITDPAIPSTDRVSVGKRCAFAACNNELRQAKLGQTGLFFDFTES
ncbi:uncharacterized protein KY384_007647 [Bacidia gigantensis]|uniref:uncharacterized protein n=1 Tax=Bacidia gigantensis TaxID=2732470 RepID=UPI001D04F8C7|nr:uncharacterized protein KY384_007647 [Bacidia gigantensis]KAG8527495.1 hypothetical protein KY384_007647 [Bacidia gigantensis]